VLCAQPSRVAALRRLLEFRRINTEATVFQVAFASWLGVLTLAAAQATVSTPATGQISGRVLDDATNQPLANARVFLYPNPFRTVAAPRPQ
jgi:hypothetical protein